MIIIASAFLISLLSYLIIPGLGGLHARTRWRRFRKRVQESVLLPEVAFDRGGVDEPLGPHRFIGRIEALQDSDSLWIKGDAVSIQALMSDSEIYILPPETSGPPDLRAIEEERLPEGAPGTMSWKQMTTLQEGHRVYLVGFLERRDGVLRMFGSRDVPLLSILHESDDVIPRAVWSGRQKNEYWNNLTPWSLLAGSLSLFIMASAVFRTYQASLSVRLLLLQALFPIIPLLPPGVVFFFFYLANWRRARFLRAERDLLGLNAFLRAADVAEEMAGWGDSLPGNTVPLIKSCRRRALISELTAALAFIFGFIVNSGVTLFILGYVT